MRIAIIGAGNMGGAIARGLAQSGQMAKNGLVVANPSRHKLEALQAEYSFIRITQSNVEAVRDADLLLLAVKPWKMEEVARELKPVLDYRALATTNCCHLCFISCPIRLLLCAKA